MCPALPTVPALQDADVPWGGSAFVADEPFFFLGKECVGHNYPAEVYGQPRSCPKVQLRTHK